MRRVWMFLVFIILVGLPALLPRAASAQSVELSFLVSEDSFQSLVSELELQGASIDNARALWGPYYFNLTQGFETYVDYVRWPETGRHKALSEHWKINGHQDPNKPRPEWNRKMFERSLRIDRFFRHEQRRLTREFFDGMRELVPHRKGIVDSYQRALNRSALLQAGRMIIGGHIDLVRIMEGLSRAYPDSALARSFWTDDFRSILDAYERKLDASLLERDLVILNRPNSETLPSKPEDPDELREWWDQDAIESAKLGKYHFIMRQFNQVTTRKLAEALPAEQAALFLERANLLISPFAYSRQGWQFWIEQALKQDDLEDEQRDVLLAWQVIYDRERDQHIRDLVRLYDFRSNPEQILKRHRRMNEVSQKLRTWNDRMTEAELAYDEAITAYENFNNEVTAKIRSLIGERAESIAGIVLVKLEAQESDIEDDQMNEFMRERREKDRESMFPRYEQPFINASEFKQCVATIAFADDERKAIFESLYDDFHAGFVSVHEKFENDRRIAAEKDILENLSRSIYESSGKRNSRPSSSHSFDWMQRWTKLRLTLESDFADQVRLFLNEDEHHIWNQELRRFRRLRMIPTIRISLNSNQRMHTYDLIELVKALELKPHAQEGFSNLLQECELAIDAVCYRYENEYDSVVSQLFVNIAARRESPTNQLEKERKRIDEVFMELRAALSNLIQRFVPLFADALEADERQRFLEAIDKQEYPWLYLESPAEMLRAALRRDNVLEAELSLALDEQEKELDFTRREFRRQYLSFMRRYDKENDEVRLLELMEDIFQMALRRSNIDHEACGDILRLIPPHQREELTLDIRLLLETVP